MRFGVAVAACCGLALMGCGGSSSSSSSGGSSETQLLPPQANAGGPYTATVGATVAVVQMTTPVALA